MGPSSFSYRTSTATPTPSHEITPQIQSLHQQAIIDQIVYASGLSDVSVAMAKPAIQLDVTPRSSAFHDYQDLQAHYAGRLDWALAANDDHYIAA